LQYVVSVPPKTPVRKKIGISLTSIEIKTARLVVPSLLPLTFRKRKKPVAMLGKPETHEGIVRP
jgi:hypothetical protein